MATPVKSAAACRFHPRRSIRPAMMFSKTAMTVERAAKLMKRKKRVLQSCPLGIWLNMLGSVTKIRPGPAPGLTP